MLVILINWLYIGITTFLTGYAILGLFVQLFDYKVKHTVSYFLAGLVFATVYAQIYSLFAGVSIMANVLLCVLCMGIAVWKRKELALFLKVKMMEWKQQSWKVWFGVILLLLMAYGTSRGYMHFDTSLYHAQSIRWIEEYGVVPGLANLQSRFGYNSSTFALTALYSMKYVFGQSLHAVAGFVALISSFIALGISDVFTDKKVRLSDFARIGLLFYLSVIFGEMMSPASDYYAMLFLFDILILWLSEDEFQKEEQKRNATPYGMLCVLLVCAVTIKFSVAPLLLLVIKPAVILLKKKDIKQIVFFLLSGLMVCVPFFIRNVIISGWLIYPSTIIDLFSVDWKLPKGQVEYDAAEIGIYGKGITDVTLIGTPFWEWFPNWFENLKALEKLFVLMTFIAIICGVIYTVILIVRKYIQKRIVDFNFSFIFVTFTVSTVFWFVSAPLIRYGYAYVVAMPLVTFGFFYLRIMEQRWIQPYVDRIHFIFCGVVVLFLLTRVKGVGENILRSYHQPYYIHQMDYEDGDAVTRVVDGIVFYVPTDRALIGYEKFPSSVFPWPIELRGDTIEDGFRQIKE